jgi:hypothetical protein
MNSVDLFDVDNTAYSFININILCHDLVQLPEL